MSTEKLGVLAPFLLVEGLLGFAALMLFQMDWIVNNMLYSYDLVFSMDWAMPYWTVLRIASGLVAFAMITVGVFGYVSYRNARSERESVVFICKSCGNAWTELNSNVKVKEGLPKFKILKSCASCDNKLLDE